MFAAHHSMAWLAILCLMAYVASFAISLGPIFWLLISERQFVHDSLPEPPQRALSKGEGDVCLHVTSTVSWLVRSVPAICTVRSHWHVPSALKCDPHGFSGYDAYSKATPERVFEGLRVLRPNPARGV
jgi:hypothetical protein